MALGTGLSRRRAGEGAPSLLKQAVKCKCGSGFRIGACGCNGVGTRGSAVAASVAGAVAGSAAQVAAGWQRGCSCDAPLFPRGFDQDAYRDALVKLDPQEPYVDMLHDFMTMDVLYSNIVTIAAGLTVNVPVLPEAGCFLAFYWRIIVRTPGDGLQQVDWTYQRPRIQGCPIECDNLDRNIMGQFAMSTPEACPCGIPLRAFIQRPSENLPLNTPVTNGGAADITAQVEARGFCCSTRIC
jgi:hypothetical protein